MSRLRTPAGPGSSGRTAECAGAAGHMDDLGELVSAFVEEQVGGPASGEGDLWFEAVCASLFSVAFDVLVHLKDITESPERLQETARSLVEAVTTHAAAWVNGRLGDESPPSGQPPIVFEMSPLMRNRLVVYFNEAIVAMADRGFGIDAARSHACFGGLQRAVAALAVKGLSIGPGEMSDFVKEVMEGCDSMSEEVVAALERKRKPRS